MHISPTRRYTSRTCISRPGILRHLNSFTEENRLRKGLTPSTIWQSRDDDPRGDVEEREKEADKSNSNDSFRVHCRSPEGSVFERNARKVAPFFAARHSHNCDLRGTGQLRPPDNGAATRNGQSNNLDSTVVCSKNRANDFPVKWRPPWSQEIYELVTKMIFLPSKLGFFIKWLIIFTNLRNI